MRKNTFVIAAAGAGMLALLCGCKPEGAASAAPQIEPPLKVRTVLPNRGEIARDITLPGEVRAYQEATLYAKVAGYLKTIPVDKGDRVKEGDLIADIEVPEMLSDLAKCKADLEVAQADYERAAASRQSSPDLVTPQTVDEAKARLDVAKASLDRTETLLKYARVVAPFSGIVTERFVDPGAFIPAATSGSAARSAAIITLMDFNRVRVQAAVPELEASKIAVGQPASVSVEGLPGRIFNGEITRFSYALDEASKTMLAEVELANPKVELRPGMYANVRIAVQKKADALLVPLEAVIVEKTGASVYTVSDHKAKKVRVETGFNDGVHVEIAGGLNPNQSVILLGKQAVTDGGVVNAVEGK